MHTILLHEYPIHQKERQSFSLGYFIMRIEAVYCLQGEKTVRKHLQTKKNLQRLLKSMRKPSLRIFFCVLQMVIL